MATDTRPDEQQVRDLIERWATATREGRQNDVLANHAPAVLIYDVLPPLQYDGAAAYRTSWDEWQPDTVGPARFELDGLRVVAGSDVAFAHALIHCGGTLDSGRTFTDTVRATFCLRKVDGRWQVAHQHISMPVSKGDG